MLGRTYDKQNCSAARALESVGERWSLLIIRDALFAGTTRFNDFQRNLHIAPNVLAARLDGFLKAGIMTIRPAAEGDHHEYVLTPKGVELAPVIIALTRWGDRWAAKHGPPILYGHNGCAGVIEQTLHCTRCGAEPSHSEIRARPGPGAKERRSRALSRSSGT